METGAIFLVVVIFVIVRVLKQVGEAARRGQSPPVPRAPGEAPQTMAELLLEMRQQVEAARRQPPGRVAHPVPAARFPGSVPDERGGSIEVASREVTIREVDQDDGAEALVQRRIAAAAARNGEWQPSDRQRFDARLHAVTPPVPSVRPRHPLRSAMIWREVLSPPVTLRTDDER